MADEQNNDLTPLQKAEARRAELKAAARAEYEAQHAQDIEAICELEIQHGPDNVAVVKIPLTSVDGKKYTAAAVRTPSKDQIKRYRESVTPRPNSKDVPDHAAAAEALAYVCVVFPSKDELNALCEARPGLKVQLGVAALELASGSADREGKG